MHEKRVRKGLKLSVLAGLLALIMVLTAFAANEIPDINATGSIAVHMNTISDGTGEKVGGGTMTIYRVAEIRAVGGTQDHKKGGYFFHILDDFKDSGVDLDGKTEDDLSSQWPELAQQLANYISVNGITGVTESISDDGAVNFTDLDTGLYLFVQETPADGYYAVDPFLVSLPLYVEPAGEYNYEVDASPKVQAVPGPEKDVDTNTDDEYDDNGVLVEPGQELSYKISFTNSHALPAMIVITDELDKNVEYIDGSAKTVVDDQEYDCDVKYDDYILTFTLTDVPARADGYVTFTVKVQEPDSDDDIIRIENTAWVKVGNDSDVNTNVVRNPIPRKDVDVDPDDGLNYGDDGKVVGVGQILTYKINYENGHDEPAIVIITDRLDDNVSYVAGSASKDGVYDSSAHTIKWTINAGAREADYVTFEVEVLESAVEPGEVENEATVKVGNDDEVKTNKVHNPVPHKDVDINPDNGLDYGDNGKGIQVGDTLTYKIDYENTLDETVTVTITDVLDEGLDYVSSDPRGEVSTDENGYTVITWTISNVEAGAKGSVTFTATVNENAVEEKEVDNTAKVSIGDNSDYFVDTNTVHNPVREFYPIDEEIVTDQSHESDKNKWVKRDSVNEFNAIEFEMTTNLPSVAPQDIADGEFALLFHNVLDSELKVDEHEDADIHITIEGKDEPVPEEYYTVEVYDRNDKWSIQALSLPVGLDTDDGVCTFHVAVDLSGLYNIGFIEDDDFLGDTEITVYFYADLEGTELNGTYKSTIHYQVYDGYDFSENSLLYTSNYSVVEVYTYEVDVSKTSTSTGNPLAGAVFGIYYDEDCTDPVIRWDGESYAEYIVTSNSEGKAKFYGLAEGTYYLKELEAPSGYIYSDEVYPVELGDLDVNETKSITLTPAVFAGATFGVYYDEDCTDPVKREGDDYTVEADAGGNIEIYGLSGDTYYLKEIAAPEGRNLSDEIFAVSLDENTDSFTYILGVGNTPSSSGTSHHGGGGSGGGGGSSGGGSGSGGPGSSGSGDSGESIWDLLPLPQTGQGWAMLIAVCALIVAGIGLIVTCTIRRKR